MRSIHVVTAIIGCLLAPCVAKAQEHIGKRNVVIPNPRLIHCRTAQCSQMWGDDSDSSGQESSYPSQVRTDLVNGSIVGLTAVYDKSVNITEIRNAIDRRYAKWAVKNLTAVWRVESEQLAIYVWEEADGTTQLIYLQFGHSASLVPAAHIPCSQK